VREGAVGNCASRIGIIQRACEAGDDISSPQRQLWVQGSFEMKGAREAGGIDPTRCYVARVRGLTCFGLGSYPQLTLWAIDMPSASPTG